MSRRPTVTRSNRRRMRQQLHQLARDLKLLANARDSDDHDRMSTDLTYYDNHRQQAAA